jgi:hypothetical protein
MEKIACVNKMNSILSGEFKSLHHHSKIYPSLQNIANVA